MTRGSCLPNDKTPILQVRRTAPVSFESAPADSAAAAIAAKVFDEPSATSHATLINGRETRLRDSYSAAAAASVDGAQTACERLCLAHVWPSPSQLNVSARRRGAAPQTETRARALAQVSRFTCAQED